MPSDDVESFIEYYRLLREDQPYLQENPRILSIKFEELVYEYDETTSKINAFLNIKNDYPKTIFAPERSAANTNLIRRFPELQDDINKIEKALPQYLFPFEKYQEFSNTGDMFMDRSPQNPIIRAADRNQTK